MIWLDAHLSPRVRATIEDGPPGRFRRSASLHRSRGVPRGDQVAREAPGQPEGHLVTRHFFLADFCHEENRSHKAGVAILAVDTEVPALGIGLAGALRGDCWCRDFGFGQVGFLVSFVHFVANQSFYCGA